ncbi:hypothetical protein MU649_15940, partial [Salmonella enterica subsp. enterica serovar Enteritidis]|nr:hypothetical protein [Salmonella enterica subsp. enterica serovar Enteritidis]
MRYFFMAEPIRAMEGDLLGVEITTHFASSPARPLHPEFVISSWDNSQKRRFLLDLLRTIAAKHGWFLRHGLFCIVNIDRGAKWHLNRSQFGIRIDHDLASISDHSLASQSITIWHAS